MSQTSITVTPLRAYPDSTVTVNGVTVASGAPCDPVSLGVGDNIISIMVTAADGVNRKTYTVKVVRLPGSFVFNSAADVPLTVSDWVAEGDMGTIALGFAPVPGTQLTVVKNTGPNPTRGTFGNLAQGQWVNLAYNGITYVFLVDYYGGTGNDLVLRWANNRLLMWGFGAGANWASSRVPMPVEMSGVFAGRQLVSSVTGGSHFITLCSDGTLVTWGNNSFGQLGNNSTTESSVPTVVDQAGVLADRKVVAVAAGSGHSLALCADGTLAAWGSNAYGQLGNNSLVNSSVPVLVDRTGVLAGRTIIAIAAGENHSLALCTDGTLATWGYNNRGQLGDNSTNNCNLPVAVIQSGALAGKTVTTISAGGNNCLVLCADGTLVAWGMNGTGQLGRGSGPNSSVPVAVTQTGVLAGKPVIAIAVGSLHSLALCSDGTVAAWGYNYYGALGINSTISSYVPAMVIQNGVLAGKPVVAIAAGSDDHSLAVCADGTLATWGYNNYGQLGDNSTTQRNVPVLASTGMLEAGERFAAVCGGSAFSLGTVAMPPPPLVTTTAATNVTDTTAMLNGSVNASGTSTTVSFEYGATTAYGATAVASPTTLAGTTVTTVGAAISGLAPGNTWHFRVVATRTSCVVKGDDMTFTTGTQTVLSSLACSSGSLTPAFNGNVTTYMLSMPDSTPSLTVTPVAVSPTAVITVNGTAVASGSASGAVALTVGENTVAVEVNSADGLHRRTYNLKVTRLPQSFTFNSVTDVPLRVSDLVAAGSTVSYGLNFAPMPGTVLMMVNNTGSNAIRGAFDNLAQGQRVQMTYAGITYHFIANYDGGNGNDLVLQWADARLLSWGGNSYGQLGNNSTANSSVPQPVDMTGALANKTVVAIVSGDSHSLALCLDGTLAAWGNNSSGQLGNGSTIPSGVPVAIDQSGALAGRRVVAISTRSTHNLALCADGTVAAWGWNTYGQLGNGTSDNSRVPVMVNTSGVLAGRKVIAIAAGGNFSLFLCADGSLAACGNSTQLGNNSTTSSNVPVLVDRSGVLAGRTVTSIAAGSLHGLVLCADGTLVAWGDGSNGQLGTTSSGSKLPVRVDQLGALLLSTVTAIACGTNHNLALCDDGAITAWGSNSNGQLGNLSISNSSTPVIINPVGLLAGRSLVAATGGGAHSLAFGPDGMVAGWGSNSAGQLGNGTTTTSTVPVWVNGNALYGGERAMAASAGGSHSLLMAAMALPSVTTLPATAITTAGATLNCEINANGNATTVAFEYGATSEYGNTLAGSPASVSGGTTTAVSLSLGGFAPGTVCHFRVVATNRVGIVRSADQLLVTPSDNARLASISLSAGSLTPAFDPSAMAYLTTVPHAIGGMRVISVTEHPGAVVRINGVVVTSGTASDEIALAVGDTAITVEVTAEDGVTMRDYAISVTRLPMEFVFQSATEVPLTCGGLDARGLAIQLELDHAPVPGTVLMAVNNTGGDPIRGNFADLEQGRHVTLDYRGVHYDFAANYAGGTGNDLVLELLAIRPYDVDLDGIEDLIEYAFGTDPLTNRPNPPPQPSLAGGRMEVRFTEPEGGTLIYGAEWSPDLAPGNWTDVPDSGTGAEHVFSVPAGESRGFLRLKVTQP